VTIHNETESFSYRRGRLVAISAIACLAAVLIASCHAPKRVQLMVSVAASLTGAIEPIENAYTQQHPDVEFRNNFGSSGSLARQIEQGAPVDLFLSAGAKPVDELKAKGLTDANQSRVLLRNTLVLITPPNSAVTSIAQLNSKQVVKIALGEPSSVPAGQYAMQTLQSAKLYDALQPKLVYAKDVRQVLAYVESGNVEAGFVYATDAKASGRVRVAQTIPGDLHQPIVYPLAVVAQSEHTAQARQFADFLFSSQASKVFATKGFLVSSH
jgi:molybdate transport system substrate-binding protein